MRNLDLRDASSGGSGKTVEVSVTVVLRNDPTTFLGIVLRSQKFTYTAVGVDVESNCYNTRLRFEIEDIIGFE